MEILLAIVIGLLYAAGVYLLLRRSIVKLILGIMFFFMPPIC
jgi:multicomponent Na+:H+ antiporter subunit C